MIHRYISIFSGKPDSFLLCHTSLENVSSRVRFRSGQVLSSQMVLQTHDTAVSSSVKPRCLLSIISYKTERKHIFLCGGWCFCPWFLYTSKYIIRFSATSWELSVISFVRNCDNRRKDLPYVGFRLFRDMLTGIKHRMHIQIDFSYSFFSWCIRFFKMKCIF